MGLKEWTRGALRGIESRLASAPNGARHNALYAAAARAGSLVERGLIGRNSAQQVLEAGSRANGLAAENPRDVKKTIEDGLEAGMLRRQDSEPALRRAATAAKPRAGAEGGRRPLGAAARQPEVEPQAATKSEIVKEPGDHDVGVSPSGAAPVVKEVPSGSTPGESESPSEAASLLAPPKVTTVGCEEAGSLDVKGLRQTNMDLEHTCFSTLYETQGRLIERTWSQICEQVKRPPASERGKRKENLPLWSFALFRDGIRGGREGRGGEGYENITGLNALQLDIDSDPAIDATQIRGKWGSVAFAAHTTASHTAAQPRWRLLIPLSRKVTPYEYGRIMREWAIPRQGLVDECCAQPSRAYFVPQPADGYVAEVNEDAKFLDPDEVLRQLRPEQGLPDQPATPALDRLCKPLSGLDEDPDWLMRPRPDRPALLLDLDGRPYLPMGVVGLLVASGGAGKTQLLTQLAVAIATGSQWLGSYRVSSPGPVLLVLGEEDMDEVKRRVQATVEALGLTRPDKAEAREQVLQRVWPLAMYGKDVCLISPGDNAPSKFCNNIIEFLETARDPVNDRPMEWRAVVVDPLSRFAGESAELDNAAATRFITVMEAFTQVPGHPTVLIAHHVNKTAASNQKHNQPSDQTAARGSSGLVAGARWVANLDTETPDEQLIERLSSSSPDGNWADKRLLSLRLVKTNYTASRPPLQLVGDRTIRPASSSERAILRQHQKDREKGNASRR